ncbi:MAG: DUF2817 domain-containing protein [Alphaproteobacteria bacterium]|nr:DUF2817 domain-containing protein [Alphaproteobacteria bacterium]
MSRPTAQSPVLPFADSYAEAREGFLAAARGAGARLSSYATGLRGRLGEELATDVAVLGDPAGPRALVLVSGTHGIEGFFGSAAQRAFLTQTRVPRGMRVVLIHALNPHGFSHERRADQENIDLNRNFLDHEAPYPDNPDYERLADAIVPASLEPRTLGAANEILKAYIARHGALAFQSAVSRGQYTHPEGLCFGGTGPAWSNRTLHAIFRDHLSGVEDVVFIDMHTGLGPRGEAELIIETVQDSPAFRRAQAIWGPQAKASHDGESVSPPLVGTIDEAVASAFGSARAAIACLEVGTVSPTETFLALRSDGWLHTRGDPDSPQGREIKARMRAAFAPRDDVWRAQVLAAASGIIGAGLAALTTPRGRAA